MKKSLLVVALSACCVNPVFSASYQSDLETAERLSREIAVDTAGHERVVAAWARVLAARPDHKQAKRELARIAWEYASLVDRHTAAGEPVLASVYIDRLREHLAPALPATFKAADKRKAVEAQRALAVFYREGIFLQPSLNEACRYYAASGVKPVGVRCSATGAGQPLRKASVPVATNPLAAAEAPPGGEPAELATPALSADIEALVAEALRLSSRDERKRQSPADIRADLDRFAKRVGPRAGKLRRAAKSDARAAEALGFMYRRGLGVRVNHKRSCGYYENGTSPSALYWQAQCAGARGETDAYEALLAQAAAENHLPSIEALITHHAIDNREPGRAVVYARQGAKLGDPGAAALLGWMSETGSGLDQDVAQAAIYYEFAALRGNAGAMNNLGRLHETGAIGKPDVKTAAEWYVKAAKAGSGRAAYNMAQLVEAGKGFSQDYCVAWQWAQNAVDRSMQAAKGDELRLKKLCDGGRPPARAAKAS